MTQAEIDFDGQTFDQHKDGERLTGQLSSVHAVMSSGQWRTLAEIRELIGVGTETGISARLRDLRKPKFGGFVVESRRRNDSGCWEYRVRKEVANG